MNQDSPEHLREKWELLGLLTGTSRRIGEDPNWDGKIISDEKSKRKRMYNTINHSLDVSDIGEYAFFLNYGYMPLAQTPQFSPIVLNPKTYDGNSHRLVLEVIGDCPLQGRDILDIGCGRGGVAHVLKAHFNIGSYLGVDLSSEAISFCKEAHETEGYSFLEGDAEHLPIASGAKDVVINIESSNCYPNINRFFHEVKRVLRKKSWFLYADLLRKEEFVKNRRLLEQAGFEIVRDIDISPNVLRACDETGARRLRAYEDLEERRYMANFLASPGSELYQCLKDGRVQYRLYKLWKP